MYCFGAPRGPAGHDEDVNDWSRLHLLSELLRVLFTPREAAIDGDPNTGPSHDCALTVEIYRRRISSNAQKSEE